MLHACSYFFYNLQIQTSCMENSKKISVHYDFFHKTSRQNIVETSKKYLIISYYTLLRIIVLIVRVIDYGELSSNNQMLEQTIDQTVTEI